MNYSDAVKQIVAERKRRISEYEQYELDCLRSNFEFAENEKKLRAITLDKALGKKTSSTELKSVQAENKKIRERLGLVPPAPKCVKCNDTGKVKGKFCDCAISLALNSSQEEIGIPLHDFEKVDYRVYGDKQEDYRKIFGYVNKICSAYPDNKKRCVIISGTTGNGKTYLAGCAAQKLLERNLSTMALTAFAANNRFLKYHTTFDENKSSYLDPMLDCAALIIDDLGTESVLKNVTVEYLYQIINERNMHGLLTVITTNLTPNQLLERYGERVYSRLFDKSLSMGFHLSAPDIRKGI